METTMLDVRKELGSEWTALSKILNELHVCEGALEVEGEIPDGKYPVVFHQEQTFTCPQKVLVVNNIAHPIQIRCAAVELLGASKYGGRYLERVSFEDEKTLSIFVGS